MMKKKCFCVLVFLLTLPGICQGTTVTVTDQAGRIVRVKQPVERVVTTFIPSTLFALCADLGSALVGASDRDGSASVYKAVVDPAHPPVFVGNRTVGLNLETITSLSPDLVIIYGQKDGIRLADRLTAVGIPVIVIMPETLDKMNQTLDLIGTASGRKDHTDRVTQALDHIRGVMEERLVKESRPKVYYASSRLLNTVSGDMLQNEMIRLAGGNNVSENTRGFFIPISREQLLSWNPDIILASDRLSEDAREKLNGPEFEGLGAVKHKKVFRIPAGTYWDFPSPFAMAGVLWMSSKIHPRAFSASEIREAIHRLYDIIFGKGFSQDHPEVAGDL